MADSGPIPVNNEQVLQWKSSTPNQYRNRGHVAGTLVRVYQTRDRDHDHMEVQIGSQSTDTIEVIYNDHFGVPHNLAAGDQVEACGDYKTSNAPSGHYQPSPDGAIVHWVHEATHGHHPSGYLVINGILYGQGNHFRH